MASTRRHTPLPAKKRGEDGRPLCRWCGAAVPKGRISWCSEACVEEYRIRSDPGHVRYLLEQRDHGICARCGLDCQALARWFKRLRQRPMRFAPCGIRSGRRREVHLKRDQARLLAAARDFARRGFRNFSRYMLGGSRDTNRKARHFWDADHVLPVVEGGGECGIDNYRTLCTPCHKAVTRELAARRAAARKRQISLPLATEPRKVRRRSVPG